MKFLAPIFLILATSLHAATLPGFRVEPVADVPGFVSSVVADSHGILYCTNTSGVIFRIDGSQATPIATLPTHEGGNGGLLGMALVDDTTAVVHYTSWFGERVLDDVVSLVDLRNGAETVMHDFVCDIEQRERGASDEHHGGNPTVASDGTIFVGIGEYNDFQLAQKPEWNGGKIFSIDRDGNVAQFALGLRNPYDLAWDPELERIVVSDNGPTGGDKLHIIDDGSNCGWPPNPPVPGAVAPDYVFPETVAPTGLARLTRDANPLLRRGYLLGSFVTRSLYYFSDLAARPVAAPLAIVDHFDEAIIDVTQAPDGNVYLATARFPPASRIQRLVVPARGDCNGDGFADSRDVSALLLELGDGPHSMISAQDGVYAGSWGCDANADGLIDSADLSALGKQLSRKRAVKVR